MVFPRIGPAIQDRWQLAGRASVCRWEHRKSGHLQHPGKAVETRRYPFIPSPSANRNQVERETNETQEDKEDKRETRGTKKTREAKKTTTKETNRDTGKDNGEKGRQNQGCYSDLSVDFLNLGAGYFPSKIPFEKCFKISSFS